MTFNLRLPNWLRFRIQKMELLLNRLPRHCQNHDVGAIKIIKRRKNLQTLSKVIIRIEEILATPQRHLHRKSSSHNFLPNGWALVPPRWLLRRRHPTWENHLRVIRNIGLSSGYPPRWRSGGHSTSRQLGGHFFLHHYWQQFPWWRWRWDFRKIWQY